VEVFMTDLRNVCASLGACVALVVATGLAQERAPSPRAKRIAQAKSQLSALSAALSMYMSDQGRYPRLAPRDLAKDGGAWRDDCVGLYRALMYAPTRELGGGQNAPYLDGRGMNVAYCTASAEVLAQGMPTAADGKNPTTEVPEAEREQLESAKGQAALLAAGKHPVFVDPWGNPIHYREWASVRSSSKDLAVESPVVREVAAVKRRDPRHAAPVKQASDRPHRQESFDLWSNGPNGINEYGHPDSDDVVGWSR